MNISELRERASAYRAAADQLDRNADEIESIESNFGAAIATPAKKTGKRGRPVGSKNKRGRPAGSKNKTKGKRGRPAGSKNKTTKAKAEGRKKAKAGNARKGSLRSYIIEILTQKKGGLDLEGLVEECRARGYKSNSKKFSNMVYQTINSMVSGKSAEFNEEDRKYRLVKAA